MHVDARELAGCWWWWCFPLGFACFNIKPTSPDAFLETGCFWMLIPYVKSRSRIDERGFKTNWDPNDVVRFANSNVIDFGFLSFLGCGEKFSDQDLDEGLARDKKRKSRELRERRKRKKCHQIIKGLINHTRDRGLAPTHRGLWMIYAGATIRDQYRNRERILHGSLMLGAFLGPFLVKSEVLSLSRVHHERRMTIIAIVTTGTIKTIISIMH